LTFIYKTFLSGKNLFSSFSLFIVFINFKYSKKNFSIINLNALPHTFLKFNNNIFHSILNNNIIIIITILSLNNIEIYLNTTRKTRINYQLSSSSPYFILTIIDIIYNVYIFKYNYLNLDILYLM